MEEPPAIPGEHLWRQAEESFNEDDALAWKLVGIQSALMAWRAKDITSTPDTDISLALRRERDEVQRWFFNELNEFFFEAFRTNRLCRLTVGDSDSSGHRLARLGKEYALFETGLLAPGSVFTLDYAKRHPVPQGSDFDKVPGLMATEQVYLGDKNAGMAISLNQVALTLRDNGQIEIL